MFALLTLTAIAVGMRWFLLPTLTLQRGVARMLDDAKTAFHFGLSSGLVFTAAGRFSNRRATLQIVQPRKHVAGEVLLAMEARAPDGADWKDSSLTRADPDLSRATFDVEGRYGLILTLTGGWLRATWNPLPGLRFPGRFDEEQWRNTLTQMHVIAEWLERRHAR